jgi:hypothetical protein
MTHYMTLTDAPLIYRLPYRGTKKPYNDNLPPTVENFAVRFDVCAEGVARGIITVDCDD